MTRKGQGKWQGNQAQYDIYNEYKVKSLLNHSIKQLLAEGTWYYWLKARRSKNFSYTFYQLGQFYFQQGQ